MSYFIVRTVYRHTDTLTLSFSLLVYLSVCLPVSLYGVCYNSWNYLSDSTLQSASDVSCVFVAFSVCVCVFEA